MSAAAPIIGHNGGPALDAPTFGHAEARRQLAAMLAALKVVRAHRERVAKQMRDAAEDVAVARLPRSRCGHGRMQSRWTGEDERSFQDALVDQHFARGRELDALDAKAARQGAAIAAFRRKWRFND